MKILYYDCFSGISGDMNLGAMIDLGIEKEFLEAELGKLNLKGWELKAEKDQRHGIQGTKVTVRQTQKEHHHRHLSDIRKIINSSSLDDSVKNLSLKIFGKIAEAEAKVHNIPVEKVHFHEVGAIDSIIDIVGAAICFESLDVDEVHISPLELGGGTVRCDHGRLPVPAPATAEIVRDIPATLGGVDFEATTPTGAAIATTIGTVFNKPVPLKIIKTGYGIGHKEHPEVPNILRVFLAETEPGEEQGHDAMILECNIDDMNPEFYDHLSDKLFREGASDVYLTSIVMKKGRPGIKLSIICEKDKAEGLRDIIFTESTTLGLRTFTFKKDTLVRKFERTDTSFGQVMVKKSYFKGREVSCKPEYDDCRRLADQRGITVKEVYNRIIGEIAKKKYE